MQNSNCKNCGADRGLHHYETMQCPVGGREAPVGRKQEWMTLTFEIDNSETADELSALRARVTELTEKLTEALLNPTLLAESASAWSIRNQGYPLTASMNEKADYYESIVSVLQP